MEVLLIIGGIIALPFIIFLLTDRAETRTAEEQARERYGQNTKLSSQEERLVKGAYIIKNGGYYLDNEYAKEYLTYMENFNSALKANLQRDGFSIDDDKLKLAMFVTAGYIKDGFKFQDAVFRAYTLNVGYTATKNQYTKKVIYLHKC